jgi:hypothetical protein
MGSCPIEATVRLHFLRVSLTLLKSLTLGLIALSSWSSNARFGAKHGEDGEHRTCNNRATFRSGFIVRPSLCIRMMQSIIITGITNFPKRGTSIGDLTGDRIKSADSISQATAARRRGGYA